MSTPFLLAIGLFSVNFQGTLTHPNLCTHEHIPLFPALSPKHLLSSNIGMFLLNYHIFIFILIHFIYLFIYLICVPLLQLRFHEGTVLSVFLYCYLLVQCLVHYRRSVNICEINRCFLTPPPHTHTHVSPPPSYMIALGSPQGSIPAAPVLWSSLHSGSSSHSAAWGCHLQQLALFSKILLSHSPFLAPNLCSLPNCSLWTAKQNYLPIFTFFLKFLKSMPVHTQFPLLIISSSYSSLPITQQGLVQMSTAPL